MEIVKLWGWVCPAVQTMWPWVVSFVRLVSQPYLTPRLIVKFKEITYVRIFSSNLLGAIKVLLFKLWRSPCSLDCGPWGQECVSDSCHPISPSPMFTHSSRLLDFLVEYLLVELIRSIHLYFLEKLYGSNKVGGCVWWLTFVIQALKKWGRRIATSSKVSSRLACATD